jgi:hypothetical protein
MMSGSQLALVRAKRRMPCPLLRVGHRGRQTLVQRTILLRAVRFPANPGCRDG